MIFDQLKEKTMKIMEKYEAVSETSMKELENIVFNGGTYQKAFDTINDAIDGRKDVLKDAKELLAETISYGAFFKDLKIEYLNIDDSIFLLQSAVSNLEYSIKTLDDLKYTIMAELLIRTGAYNR